MIHRHLLLIVLAVTVATIGAFALSAWRDAAITAAAMQYGYEQQWIDGELLWRKRGYTTSEWLAWIAKEIRLLF